MTNFDEIIFTIESFLIRNNFQFKPHKDGEDDYKYEINLSNYGFNIFIKGKSSDISCLVSPFLYDHEKTKMLLPIHEFSAPGETVVPTIKKILSKVIQDLDMYEYLIKGFSDVCYNKANEHSHGFEEGYNIVKRMGGGFHLIYYYNMLIKANHNYNKINFIFDISNLGYEFKYRVNGMEYNSITSSPLKGPALSKIVKQFNKIHDQIYVSAKIYEQLLDDPKCYGENILLFLPKKTALKVI